jgi:repressor LexA
MQIYRIILNMNKGKAIKVFNELLKELGMNPKQLSDSLGKERPQWAYDILNENKNVGISKNIAELVCEKFPQINKSWLLTGEGDMLTQKEEAPKTSSADTIKQNGYITYLLPMSAMGGSLTGFAEPGVLLQNCEAVVSPIENVDFAITVYGDSMAPEYPSGSRILIKKINPDLFIDWGKVYVLDTPNGVIVKEVHESNREGYVSCHSINPDPKFKPFDVLMDEVFGMYRVLMCLSAK